MRKFRCEIVERGADVVLFALAAIVNSLALSGTAEIETQHRDAAQMQRLSRAVNDFIVHRAAEEWMRMADDSGEQRMFRGHGPEQRFEAAGGPCEKKIAMEGVGHEFIRARV